MADDEQRQPGDGSEAERLAAVEQEQASQGAKLDQIIERLGQLLPGSHAEAQERTESRLDRASSVQEQVRAELERADAERKAQADADADKSERESMREQLARLSEQPPQPPTPRRTKFLGWGSD